MRAVQSSTRLLLFAVALLAACSRNDRPPAWEQTNPVVPLPEPPLGVESSFSDLEEPPTPERVRLGRWLFYDKRLSADGTISCATCHHPENAFSEPTPVSTGIRGQKGGRKAPSFINQAWTLYPHFFWDGRAASLEEQALGPIANPIEMGSTHEAMVETLQEIEGYARYFEEAFGSEGITKERVAKAIADYERTRMSGNSAWDRWKNGDENAVSETVKRGDELFFDKAACNQCHFGQNFTDSRFHNLGIGWDDKKKEFGDLGRYAVSKQVEDRGAFKTPTIRDVTKHAPYMHDGSLQTLREVVEHYNQGGNPNPHLSPMIEPLDLAADEIDALVAFMQALEGEGYQDTPPEAFPN
ncbi:MAG: cytochrome-c peroxidase [Candidatus Krumholzibacteriia bacterium]